MASSLQLSADLRLNPNSIKQSANQVKQALGRITGQASEFQKSLDASTARVFAFGATTVVLNTVSQAFRKLAESTIEVQKRLVEINAIFQQSESVLQNFRESIFDVAQNTGQAFSTVADAAAELARQGLSAEETTKRLQAALILTRISGLGAEDSVKTLTAAINGFTSAALTANEVTDKIVAVDTAFAVSAQDLAQGLARAGSTAEDAGVSFNELLGLITAVEQRTARGGAVIGNAFKSIFTRLSRGTTIADLQSLGVEIDATQTGVQKLQALSNAIEGIGDPTVVSKIKELAGGVFQINVVSAALKDLTSETSVFRKAADEAATASGQAFKRNETLNKSLAAQINSLVAGLTDLAEKIGSLTFAPLLTNLISVASKITETLSSALGGENGSVVIKGLFKGIGAFISGPGLVIITSAFLKIVKLIGKFAIEGFRSITLIGSETEKIKGIEKGIVNLLSQDDALRKSIASKTLSQAQKEQAVIDAIKRENQLLTQQEALLRRLATLAASRGVTGFGSGSGFTGGNKKRFSQGYVPNFARNDFKLEEAEAKSLGASSSVKARMGKGKIGGKRFVMNNQETEIPNFGRNGDSAVIPRYSKGFVPNFVNKQPPPLPKSRYGTNNQWVSVNKAKNATDSALFTSDNDAPFYPFKAKGIKSTHDEIVGEGGLVIRNRYKEWEKAENSKRIETIDLNQIVGGSLPSILIPRKASSPTAILNSQKTDILKPINYEFPVKGISGKNTEALEAKFEKDFDPQRIEKLAKNRVLKFARQITDSLGLPKGEPKDIKKTAETDGFTGAIRSAAGAIFDASVTTALNVKSKDTSKDKGGNFDVRGKNPNLKALFGQSPTPSKGPFTGLGDFKFTPDTDSLRKKSLNELRGKYKSSYEELKLERNPDKKGKATVRVPKKTTKARKKGFASGYIPNFVGNGPLGEAIKREKAAGLPESKIRVDQSQKLANRRNPTGLAVTNTRDEPNGLKDVFASGYIPNFAAKRSLRNFPLTVESSVRTDKLQSNIDEASTKTSEFSKNTDSVGQSMKLLGAGIAIQSATSIASAAATSSANNARKDEIDEINRGLEASKREIEQSNKSAEAKAALTTKLEESVQQEIKKIEATKTFTESLASGAEGLVSAGFALAQINQLIPKERLTGLAGTKGQQSFKGIKGGPITGAGFKAGGKNLAKTFANGSKVLGRGLAASFASGSALLAVGVGLALKKGIEDFSRSRLLEQGEAGSRRAEEQGRKSASNIADRALAGITDGKNFELFTPEQRREIEEGIKNFKEKGLESVDIKDSEGFIIGSELTQQAKAAGKELERLKKRYGKANRTKIAEINKQIEGTLQKISEQRQKELIDGLNISGVRARILQNEEKQLVLQDQISRSRENLKRNLDNIVSLLPEGERKVAQFIADIAKSQQDISGVGGAQDNLRQSENDVLSKRISKSSAGGRLRELKDKQKTTPGLDLSEEIGKAADELDQANQDFVEAIKKRGEAEDSLNQTIFDGGKKILDGFDSFGQDLVELTGDKTKSALASYRQSLLTAGVGADILQAKILKLQESVNTDRLANILKDGGAKKARKDAVKNNIGSLADDIKRNRILQEQFQKLKSRTESSGFNSQDSGTKNAVFDALNDVTDQLKASALKLKESRIELSGVKIDSRKGNVTGADLVKVEREYEKQLIKRTEAIAILNGAIVSDPDAIKDKLSPEGDPLSGKVQKEVEKILGAVQGAAANLVGFQQKYPETFGKMLSSASELAQALDQTKGSIAPFVGTTKVIGKFVTDANTAVSVQQQNIVKLATANSKLRGVIEKYDSNIESLSSVLDGLVGRISKLEG